MMPFNHSPWIAGLLLVVGLAVVPGAGAATVAVRKVPTGGPVLTSHGVAWQAREAHGAALWELPFGGGPARVQQFPDAGDDRVGNASMAASSDLVGLADIHLRGRGQDSHVFGASAYVGRWGAALSLVREPCEDVDVRAPGFDVSEEQAIYTSCPMGEAGPHVIEDLSTDPPQTETAPAEGPGVRMAGRYLAYLEGSGSGPGVDGAYRYGVTVFDRSTQSVVYHIPASEFGSGVRNIDVQEDGKVAVAFVESLREGVQAHTLIGWASPQEPSLHMLGVRRAGTYGVRIAGNTIAYARGVNPSGAVIPAAIGLVSLGGSERVVARNAEASGTDFDYDGRRLAWWSYGCRHPQINYLDASRSGPGLNRHGCKLRFRDQPSLSGNDLRMRINCTGFYGCNVKRIVVTLRKDPHTVIARGAHRHARLTRDGRSILRRHGRAGVRIAATITDAAGRHEHRATRLVLHD